MLKKEKENENKNLENNIIEEADNDIINNEEDTLALKPLFNEITTSKTLNNIDLNLIINDDEVWLKV